MARWIKLLFLTYVESEILLIQRNNLGDALTCESSARCLDIRAAQINKTSCLCLNGGTILSSSNYWCSTDAGQRAGCSFYIHPSNSTIKTISAKTNVIGVLKSADNCKNIEITSVQILNQNMEWGYSSFYGFNLVLNDTLMLTDNKDANGGQLWKINVRCRANNYQTIVGCVLLKFAGKRTWNSFDLAKSVCGVAEKSTTNIPTLTQTKKQTLVSQVYTTTVSKPNTRAKIDSTAKMIGLIVAAIILVAIETFVMLYIGWRIKRKKCKSSLKNSHEPTDQVETPYDTSYDDKSFQNQTYLTAMVLGQKNYYKGEKLVNNESEEYNTLYESSTSKTFGNTEYFALKRESAEYSSLNIDPEDSYYSTLNQPDYQSIAEVL